MLSRDLLIHDCKTIFYLLKHFQLLDDATLDYLLKNSSYTKNQIFEQINTHGSKFKNSFAESPFKLIETFIEIAELSAFVKHDFIKDRFIFSTIIDCKQYKDGIGLDGVVLRKNLSKEENSSLIFDFRNENLIEYVYREPLPTWQFNAVLKKISNQKYQIITMFPGIMAPPMPNIILQNSAQFEQCRKFWKQHVFIKC